MAFLLAFLFVAYLQRAVEVQYYHFLNQITYYYVSNIHN